MTRSKKSKFSIRKGGRSSYKKVRTVSVSPSGGSRSQSPMKTSNSVSGSTTQVPQSSDSDSDIDERTDLERKLFDLVNDGDVDQVRQFIKTNNAIDINKKDTEGISVLHHAVTNNDIDMVDILLADNFGIDVTDSLLHAIKENSIEMVQKLLKWKESPKSGKSIIQKLFPRRQFIDSSEYGEDLSPLLMACICGHYEIIELLYNRGERLEELHMPSCNCSKCGKSSSDLKKSNNRIQLLKGLTNPTYIAFMAGVEKGFDPVQKVFQITDDIQTCIDEEYEFHEEYEEILNAIKMFPVDMLSMCKNTHERKLFLGNTTGYNGISMLPYPRLLLAMQLGQKEFVSHTHAQELLYQDWIGEPWIADTFAESLLKKCFIALTIILFPIISIIMWFTLCCCNNVKLFKFMSSPLNRFRSSILSYAIFLTVLFCMNSTDRGESDIGPPSFYLPWIVAIFAISHILSFFRQILMNGFSWVGASGWNIFECINHIFFILTICLWIVLYNHENVKLEKKKELKRQWLEPTNVLLLSDIATGIASTMAGLRILKTFILDRTLGPMQIALGKMSKDIFTFVLFFIIIIVSFSVGVQHLYRPYISFAYEKNSKNAQTDTLASFFSAGEAFYWALFTMTDAGSPAVAGFPVGNITNHHTITESVGKLTFVFYHILCVTMLMNMLTGVMSNTYSNILENVKVEWKYARSQMWVSFIEDTVVTAPFSIIPNMLFLCTAWIRRCRFGKQQNNKRAGWMEPKESESDQKDNGNEYSALVRRLIQRYFRSKNSFASDDVPVKGDVTNVLNHVAELKKMTTLTLEHQNSQVLVSDLSPSSPSTIPNTPSKNAGTASPINTTTLSLHQSRMNPVSSRGQNLASPNKLTPISSKPLISSGSGQGTSPSSKLSRHVNFPSTSNINP